MNEYYTTIATKVSKADKQKISNIAERFGMTFYELLQALLLAIVRYFDEGTSINTDFENMVNSFIDMISTASGSFNPLSITNHKSEFISKAIFFIQRKAKQRPQMIEVSINQQGTPIESYNIDDMLSDFLKSFNPQIYNALEAKKKELGNFSTGQTLYEIIAKGTPNDGISKEVKSMFKDIRINTGQKINDGIAYKRPHFSIGDYTTIITRKQILHADL